MFGLGRWASQCSLDPAATEDPGSVVDDGGLAGGDGEFRFIETNRETVKIVDALCALAGLTVADRDRARNGRTVVADLHRDPIGHVFDVDQPVRFARHQSVLGE